MQRELAAAGCSASTAAVLRFFNRRLATAGHQRQRANAASVVPTPPPSARKLSFEFIRRPENRKPAEQERLERIRGVNAEITEALKLADEFVGMVRQRLGEGLADWLTKAAEAAAQEVRGFAGGIRQDEATVKAGLTQPWSNGPVEGQVNRLKVIKRTMYGRAGLDLLRARVVHAS
jgi:transposase